MYKIRTLIQVSLFVSLLLTGASAVAVAESAAEPAPAEASSRCGAVDVGIPSALWTLPDAGALSTCIAQCWDGSTRTCTGSSCTAYDSACPDEQGRCFTSGETLVLKKCPPCPSTPPCPSPSCEDLDGTYCKYNGTSQTCYYEVNGSCNAASCNCYAPGGNGSWVCP